MPPAHVGIGSTLARPPLPMLAAFGYTGIPSGASGGEGAQFRRPSGTIRTGDTGVHGSTAWTSPSLSNCALLSSLKLAHPDSWFFDPTATRLFENRPVPLMVRSLLPSWTKPWHFAA